MTKKIWFDMDGTIADLYAVDGWLGHLTAENTFPYDNAPVMVNCSLLARLLNELQRNGWQVGIISWNCRGASDLYFGQVALAKLCWLGKHLPSVHWDEIKIVPYGTNKWDACGGGILFDDEQNNRDAWQDEAHKPEQIIEILKGLRKAV